MRTRFGGRQACAIGGDKIKTAYAVGQVMDLLNGNFRHGDFPSQAPGFSPGVFVCGLDWIQIRSIGSNFVKPNGIGKCGPVWIMRYLRVR